MSKDVVIQSSYHPRKHDHQGPMALDVPFLIDAAIPNVMYAGIVPDVGAAIRIPTYSGANVGDVILLHWRGRFEYQTQMWVIDPNRFVDIYVPRAVVLASTSEDEGLYCQVSYTVVQAGGNSMPSDILDFLVMPDSAVPPPVVVPDAPGGELDFSRITVPPGLPVVFPNQTILMGEWLFYGSDGRPKQEIRFRVADGETVYLWREVLEQAERGGEACIGYQGVVGGFIVPSPRVRIRAL